MKWLIYILPIFLFSCSSLPKTIQDPPNADLQLVQVLGQIDDYVNRAVRWGGKIITVNNDDQQSLIQVVQFPLNGFGEPIVGKTSQGRFLIQSKQFLDPEIFKPGRLATFSGIIHAQQQKIVDKKTLYLPVIQLHEMHLWSEQKQYRQPYYGHRYLYPYPRHSYYARGYFRH